MVLQSKASKLLLYSVLNFGLNCLAVVCYVYCEILYQEFCNCIYMYVHWAIDIYDGQVFLTFKKLSLISWLKQLGCVHVCFGDI